jgi:hypothetical protein
MAQNASSQLMPLRYLIRTKNRTRSPRVDATIRTILQTTTARTLDPDASSAESSADVSLGSMSIVRSLVKRKTAL